MVAVKAVSKARTQQAAERGAAHTSAEEILKMEIEVMRDLSETRHRNLCAAAQPPPARSRPPTAAAFVPLPAHRRHPTAFPPLSRRRRHRARASPHAQHTPRPIPGPTPRPPHAHAAPPRLCSPKFYGCGEDELYVYLILQLCTGGELQDWLLRRSEQEPYTEQIAAKVAYDVLQVLACACTPMRARARARARPAFGCVRGLDRAPAPPPPAHTRCRSCGAAGAAQVPRAGHRAQRREAAQPDLQRAALGRGLAAQARRLRPRGAAQPRRRAAHRGATHAKP